MSVRRQKRRCCVAPMRRLCVGVAMGKYMLLISSPETAGYFFCLEDRALLCRKCDFAIHTVNTLVSSHQRFLLTGVKVGLEAADTGASSSTRESNSGKKFTEPEKPHTVPARIVPVSAPNQFNKVMPVQTATRAGDYVPPKLLFSGGSSADSLQQWQFDDFLAHGFQSEL